MTEQEDKNKKETTIATKNATTLADILKETMSLDQIALPVLARLKKRLKTIHDLSRAKTQKVPMGITGYSMFKTEAPKMFIAGLDSKFDGSRGAIVYMTYKTEKNSKTGELQKKLAKVQTMQSLSGKEMDINASYIIDKVYIEVFEYGKSINRQVINPDELGLN